ncbi:hypothetical protein [Thermosporothrix hazakensis]|uniref:Uncharacterized protein n=1 Tax=Thermosporothrix sp. COM3 TaxID=2490863 RepID=A0A455SHL6_9CHLR|nr:hypothetical protein [Thermosporothrix hazakensis]BBH85635.1 hypothetical protein KTC_03860 [Thermosporothrix sp. COM3]
MLDYQAGESRGNALSEMRSRTGAGLFSVISGASSLITVPQNPMTVFIRENT